ncbi:AAA family ATPase [Granulosicoccus sp. 3-233]|uniref:AAA family ATPase n=1 Tax=Granulosicoccus sp. 3-233 TaxID=3417969 RepID=UPI003D33103E
MPSQDASDIQQPALLSDVTLSALQLIQQPFGPAAPDSETFIDDTSLEQLGDVKQALVSGDDLLLILGETGSGKSVLLHQLGINSGQNIQCFAVKGSPRFSTLNLFAGMLEAFKRKPPESLKDILDELLPCLQTMVARNTLSAIVLDDADQISETELTQLLSSMLYVNSQDETLMRVALAAPPEFEDRIPDLLPEGADLPYSSLTIEGMNSERAVEYLSFRLQQAGYTEELPFSDQDLDDIIAQSGGLPGGIHPAAADVLNQLYDPTMQPPLEELHSVSKPPLLQSRNAKFGLGALAIALILGGLLMFTPDAADDEERYADNAGTTTPLPTSSLGSGADNNEPDSSTDDVIEPAAEPADDIDEDAPGLRIVEERQVVPFTSEAIESLVPEIPSPSRSSTAASSADDAANTANEAVDSDPLDSAAETVATNEPAGNDLNDPATDPAASVTPAGNDSDPAAGNDLSADGPADTLSDADLLPDTPADTLDELPDTAIAEPVQPVAEVNVNSNPGNDAVGAATQPASNDETPEVDPELVDILESPTWILVQDSSKITVQMSASRDRPSIESFLKRNRDVLPAPNSIYTFQRRGETWYALLHGLYSTFEEAQSAVEQMPDSAVTDQPWIRNVGRVQDVLKAQ